MAKPVTNADWDALDRKWDGWSKRKAYKRRANKSIRKLAKRNLRDV